KPEGSEAAAAEAERQESAQPAARVPSQSVEEEPTGPTHGRAPPGFAHRLWRLFLAFVRVGSFGFGGGPSMIPLVRIEAVKTNRWLSDEEFMEIYAVASSLPGPISTNMAGYFGWRVAGLPGSLAALFGLTFPSGIAIVLLGGLYQAT